MKEWEHEEERKRVSKRLRLANGGIDSSSEMPSSGTGTGGGQGLKVAMSYTRPLGEGQGGTGNPSISTIDNGGVGKSGLKVKKFSSRNFFRNTSTGKGGDTGNDNEEEELGLEVHKIETPPLNTDSENLLTKIEECDGHSLETERPM